MTNKNFEMQLLDARDRVDECLRAFRIDRILLFMYDCLLKRAHDLPEGENDPSGFFSYVFEGFSQHVHQMQAALKEITEIYQNRHGNR